MSTTELRAGIAPPRFFRYFEIASVVACVGLELALAREVALGLARGGLGPGLVGAVVVGAYLACDLVAGLVHFVFDSFGSIDTPFLGRTFILPFRSHHVHPRGICEHDFVETNGNNATGALIVLAPVLVFVPVRGGGADTLLGLFVCVFAVSVLLTNQIHKWAHVDSPPRLVRLLQRTGILLSPERHAPHHRAPHGRGYCVTSGLLNLVLDPLGFFPLLERVTRLALRLERSRT